MGFKRNYFFSLIYQEAVKAQAIKYEDKIRQAAGMGDLWPSILWIIYNPEVQEGINKVYRWGDMPIKNQCLRPQTVWQHTIGMLHMCFGVLAKLNGSLAEYHLDRDLLYKAFLVHDIPEGLLNRDIVFSDKKPYDEKEEFLAFTEFIDRSNLASMQREKIEQMYLLQFCFKDDKLIRMLPDSSIRQVNLLKKNYETEAYLFQAIERLEYLLYAEESYVGPAASTDLLNRVAPAQVVFFNNLIEKFPLWSKIWTPEAAAYYSQFL